MDSPRWTSGSDCRRSEILEIFDMDLDGVIELIKISGARRVGIQVPEGLKRAAPKIAKEIEDATRSEVIVSGDPCYGACDVDMELCHEVDLLIHIGHAEMLGGSPLLDKIIYLEARMKSDVKEAVEKAAEVLESKKVGLVTTVQHVHKLHEAVEVLEKQGIKTMIGSNGSRTKYPGQVLGCNYETARAVDVEEYLFIGTGQFHPLGVSLATKKRVVTADPVTGKVSVIDTKPMLKRRYGAVARAINAKKIAVLISKKPGQKRANLARRMRDLGKVHGKEMVLVYVQNAEPDILINLGVDAAVCTACPRIALDDQAKYPVPILTPPEFEILLGERKGDYRLDEME